MVFYCAHFSGTPELSQTDNAKHRRERLIQQSFIHQLHYGRSSIIITAKIHDDMLRRLD